MKIKAPQNKVVDVDVSRNNNNKTLTSMKNGFSEM